jgi:hypothetical protein
VQRRSLTESGPLRRARAQLDRLPDRRLLSCVDHFAGLTCQVLSKDTSQSEAALLRLSALAGEQPGDSYILPVGAAAWAPRRRGVRRLTAEDGRHLATSTRSLRWLPLPAPSRLSHRQARQRDDGPVYSGSACSPAFRSFGMIASNVLRHGLGVRAHLTDRRFGSAMSIHLSPSVERRDQHRRIGVKQAMTFLPLHEISTGTFC